MTVDSLHRRIIVTGIVIGVSVTMWAAALRIAVLCSPAISVANDAASYSPDEEEDLFMAVEEGDTAYVKWRILQNRAAISIRDPLQFTLLHVAASCCHPEIVRQLLHLGAEAGARDIVGDTPLHYAVRNACPAVAGILLGAGASADAANSAGVTAMQEGERYWPDASEMIRILKRSGSQKPARTGGQRWHVSSR